MTDIMFKMQYKKYVRTTINCKVVMISINKEEKQKRVFLEVCQQIKFS